MRHGLTWHAAGLLILPILFAAQSAHADGINGTPNGPVGLFVNGSTEALHITTGGLVGINSTNPMSMLHIYGGEVQVGSSSATCNANRAGAIRYASTSLYYCNATSWTSVGSGSGSGTVSIGSQYQMAFYNANGTTVTGDSSIVTDSNNDLNVSGGISVGGGQAYGFASDGTSGFWLPSYNNLSFYINSVTRLFINSSGFIGIGTTVPDQLLSLDGQSARTLDMTRENTPATAGNNLTLLAGGAFTSGTDLAGGNLILSSGISTGTRNSNIQLQTYPAAAATSSADNTATTALTISETGLATGGTGSFGNQVTTLQSTTNSGTDKNGATLNLASGISTGTGSSGINFNIYKAGTTGSAANSATTAMTVASTGYVGLASTSPAYLLDVNGGARIAGTTPIYDTLFGYNTNHDVYLRAGTAAGTIVIGDQNTGNVTLGSVGDYVIVAGKLGIGTNNPMSMLQVNGGEVQVGSSSASCTANNLGAIRYSNGSLYYCNTNAWTPAGGGGQLLGVYFSTTAATNNSIVFTGAANSAPSLSGTTLSLPSNASYIVVELWGGGGGGSGGGNGGNGGAGGTSCFGTNSTACTSSILSVTGGGAGGAGGIATGGSGSGGDVNLTGGGGGGSSAVGNGTAEYISGGVGGGAPFGGTGGNSNFQSAPSAGNAPGGGGAGGGVDGSTGQVASGGSGAGGGYSSKFISNPSGTYYYTIGSAGTAGTAGTNGFAGTTGGTGGIKISVYTSGVTNGSIGSGTANGLAYYSGAGTSLSSIASVNNAILATNGSGVPAFTSSMTVSGTNVGIGSTSPVGNLDVENGSNTAKLCLNGSCTTALGKLVQRAYAGSTTYSATTNPIAGWGTSFVSTDGAQVLSLSFTPKNSTDILRLRTTIVMSGSTGEYGQYGIFQGSTLLVAGIVTIPANSYFQTASEEIEIAAGTTSPITFTVRAGPNSSCGGCTLYFNGWNGSTYGGLTSSLVIEEMTP